MRTGNIFCNWIKSILHKNISLLVQWKMLKQWRCSFVNLSSRVELMLTAIFSHQSSLVYLVACWVYCARCSRINNPAVGLLKTCSVSAVVRGLWCWKKSNINKQILDTWPDGSCDMRLSRIIKLTRKPQNWSPSYSSPVPYPVMGNN